MAKQKKKVDDGKGIIGNVGDRIEAWRKGEKVNDEKMRGYQLAKILGISQGSLSDIQNNKSNPAADTLARFHRQCGISPVWLLTGEGPVTQLPEADKEALTSDLQLNSLIKRCIATYRNGTDAERSRFLGYLQGLES